MSADFCSFFDPETRQKLPVCGREERRGEKSSQKPFYCLAKTACYRNHNHGLPVARVLLYQGKNKETITGRRL
jgi:hypothetical protein